VFLGTQNYLPSLWRRDKTEALSHLELYKKAESVVEKAMITVGELNKGEIIK